MEPTEITAGRLHLRPWQPTDAPALQRLVADPEIARWTPFGPGYRLEDAVERIQDDPQRWADGTRAELAVLDAVTAELLGAAGLYRVTGTDAEAGWLTGAAARGQGVATDAVGAVCRWGFAALGLSRVEARIGTGNWPSRRVAERAGFAYEGTARSAPAPGGARADTWVLSLLPGDPARDTARLPAYAERTDDVVTLRRWRSSDAADVARACSDPETARWLPLPVPYTVEAGRGYVDGIVPAEWAAGAAANVAVVDATDGSLLGAVGLRLRDGVGEVGYWTAPWARGRGVAARALRLHADWGFRELRLPRIELLADVENVPSQRVAEKAGWQREGVARAVRPAPRDPVARRDMVVYARLPDQPE